MRKDKQKNVSLTARKRSMGSGFTVKHYAKTKEVHTTIKHFDDPYRESVYQPYWEYAPNWTVDGIVVREFPRKRGLPTEQVA